MCVIPAKGTSARAPNKNAALLPYTFLYIKKMGLQNRTILCSDSEEILELGRREGFKTCIEKPDPNGGSSNYGAYNAYQCAKSLGWKVEEVILLMPSFPIRAKGTLRRLIDIKEQTHTKMACPTRRVPDISNTYFEVENQKLVPNNKLGNMAHAAKKFQINAGILLIDIEVIEKFHLPEDMVDFWKQPCATIDCQLPIIDIDTPDELMLFSGIQHRWEYYFNSE